MSVKQDGSTAGRLSITLLKCIEEARPTVLGIFLLRFSVAAVMGIALSGHGSIIRAIAGAVTLESAILYVYVFNGVMDVREDRINGSGRPIARGSLERRTAARVSAAAAAVAFAGGAALGWPTFCLVAAIIMIGWQYSDSPLHLKRRPIGAPAACFALGILTYGAGFAGQAGVAWPHHELAVPLLALTMSAWMGLIGTPAKDLSDTEGDAVAGRRTLAVIWGEAAVRRLVVLAALGLSASFSWATAVAAPSLRWPSLVLTLGTLTVASVSLTRVSQGDRRRRRLPYRVFMATQYAVHLTALAVLVL